MLLPVKWLKCLISVGTQHSTACLLRLLTLLSKPVSPIISKNESHAKLQQTCQSFDYNFLTYFFINFGLKLSLMGIQIDKLSKNYGKQKALDSVSFSIKNGEVVGLLGPNGAGKSTLMKSVTGAILPDSGEIKVNEFSVLNQPIETKKRIGFLPENNPLYYEMYVREYLKFVGNIRNEKKERIEEVIQKVGLTPESHKKIGQLSKGYKQRVGLAQAILSNPEILILDEPTNGLDPNQILEIREVIREIGREKTVILSTHIMQEVEALCSRVILLNKGKIVSDSPIEEFKGQYKSLEDAFYQLTL